MSAPSVTAAALLGEAQRELLGEVFADALEQRMPDAWCADCEMHPAGLCEAHGVDLDKTDAYLALAAQLGIEVPG